MVVYISKEYCYLRGILLLFAMSECINNKEELHYDVHDMVGQRTDRKPKRADVVYQMTTLSSSCLSVLINALFIRADD